MPEPTGSAQPAATTDPGHDIFDALEGMLGPDPAYGERDALDAAAQAIAEPTADAEPVATGEPADPLTADPAVEPVAADPEGAERAAADPAAAAEDDTVEGGEGGETPTSRRGAWRELEKARADLASARTELATLKRQPSAAPVDEETARREALEFIGMAPPVDEDGKPTGEEPIFVRLHRAAQSARGIEFDDEQKLYAELSQRGGMAGKLFGLARRVAWAEHADQLVDDELGIDQAAVAAAGSITGWRARYRQAVEDRVADGHRAELDNVRRDFEQRLAEAERKLHDQAASHASQIERAAGRRAPIGAGRPSGNPNGFTSTPQSSGDLVGDLAASFAETAAGAR